MEIAHCFVLFSSVVIFTATPNIWMRKAKKKRQNVTVANQFTVQLQKVPTDAYLPWKIIFKIVFTLQIFENRLPSLVSSILGFSTTVLGQSLFAVSACFALCWVLSILSLWLSKSLTGLKDIALWLPKISHRALRVNRLFFLLFDVTV